MYLKKAIFITLLILTGFMAQSQSLEIIRESENAAISEDTLMHLRIVNPLVRVGDEIKVEMDLSFILPVLRKQLDSSITILNNDYNMFISKNLYTFNLSFDSTGEYTIGPFVFNMDSVNYYTDSVMIFVAEKLPREEGVWVRYAKTNGKRYFVLEQHISNKTKHKTKRNTYSYYVGGELAKDDELASLDKSFNDNIKVQNSWSTKKSEVFGDNISMENGYTASRKVYVLSFTDGFDGPVTITKKDFTKLPRKIKIEDIIIE